MKNLELELQLKENRRYIGEDDKGIQGILFFHLNMMATTIIRKIENCPSTMVHLM